MNIKEEIERYVPYDEREKMDKEYFIKFIDSFSNVLTRENLFGHFSSSAFVVNKARNKMVVVYHKILNGWIYPGGHADGEDNLLSVAIREVEEETGLKTKVLDENIFDISSNPVPYHIKRGKIVLPHIHFDVVYLLEADDSVPLTYREDESKGVKWVDFDKAFDESMVEFIRPIHERLIKKIKKKGIY